MTERAFSRNIEAVDEVYRFAEDILEAHDIADSVRFPVHLAIEELFTNLVKYNPDGTREILVDVSAQDVGVTVTITDFAAAEFDVTRSRPVDTQASLDERKPGGLGLYLIQRMVDTLEYDYRSGRSRIRFTKQAQQDNV